MQTTITIAVPSTFIVEPGHSCPGSFVVHFIGLIGLRIRGGYHSYPDAVGWSRCG